MTLTAVPLVKVAGAQVLASAVSRLRIEHALNSAAHLQFRFDSDHPDAGKVTIGAAVAVSVYDDDQAEATLFDGEILGLGIEMRGGRNDIVVDAYDQASRLMRESSVTAHSDVRPTDLLRSIAQAAGLNSEIDDLGTTAIPTFHQRGTLAATIDEVCRLYGADWYVNAGKLVVRVRNDAPPASGATLKAGVTLRDFSARFSAVGMVQDVTVRGWDMRTKQAIVGTGTTGSASTDLSSRPSVAAAPAGTAKSAQAWAPLVLDADTARARAKGVRTGATAGDLSGRGECDVDARLQPGTSVVIDGLGDRFSGAYRIAAVEHFTGRDQPFVTRFTIGGRDGGGLVDLLGAAGAPASHLAATTGLSIGIVTNNDDPDGLNRVKVKLPYLGEQVESGWARVVAPGAGAGRGFVALPEVNDEVLVGFEHGDIHRPYVLGGLWNGRDLPHLRNNDTRLIDGGKVALREWVSREGHRIALVDQGQSGQQIRVELVDTKTAVTLSKADGIKVEAENKPIEITNGSGNATIKLAGNGDITISGKNITITGNQGNISVEGMDVSVKGKANVKVEAGANFSAKANAGATLESSGQTVVKGTLVKVN